MQGVTEVIQDDVKDSSSAVSEAYTFPPQYQH